MVSKNVECKKRKKGTIIMQNQDSYNETTLLSENDFEEESYNETTLLSENNFDYEPYNETTLLSEENENETTLLSENLKLPPNAPKASINNIISQEKKDIDKSKFTIGSSHIGVDFYVNNPAVSRLHSQIMFIENEYYLIDNNSTNHTTLDGQIIEPNKPIRLYNGALVELADELFEFHIK